MQLGQQVPSVSSNSFPLQHELLNRAPFIQTFPCNRLNLSCASAGTWGAAWGPIFTERVSGLIPTVSFTQTHTHTTPSWPRWALFLKSMSQSQPCLLSGSLSGVCLFTVKRKHICVSQCCLPSSIILSASLIGVSATP